LAKALAEWKGASGKEGLDYTVGPEDVLEISILNLEEPGKTGKLLRTVKADGSISLPWVGGIPAGGLNTTQIEEKILSVLAERFIKDPQVTVTIANYHSAPVVVTGAVTKPGVYYLTRNRVSLLEILAQADGLSGDAGDEVLLIRGGNSVAPIQEKEGEGAAQASDSNLVAIDLKQLIDAGDVRHNVWLQSGDLLTVPARQRGHVYVLGYVQRPGSFEILKNKPMEALQAVAMAGGLSGTARAENSCLIRQTPKGQTVTPVDLTKIARGVRPPLFLEPGDTRVVGSCFLARMSEFIRPTVGAGVSYAPVP
jgi:polysaccharide export outer membrane protein